MKQAKLLLLTIPMFLLMGCYTSSDSVVLDLHHTPTPLNIFYPIVIDRNHHRHHNHHHHIERVFVYDEVEYSDYTSANPNNETSAHSHLWPNGEGTDDR